MGGRGAKRLVPLLLTAGSALGAPVRVSSIPSSGFWECVCSVVTVGVLLRGKGGCFLLGSSPKPRRERRWIGRGLLPPLSPARRGMWAICVSPLCTFPSSSRPSVTCSLCIITFRLLPLSFLPSPAAWLLSHRPLQRPAVRGGLGPRGAKFPGPSRVVPRPPPTPQPTPVVLAGARCLSARPQDDRTAAERGGTQ